MKMMMTKEEAIQKVTEDSLCFKEMIEFHDDYDVAKAALKKDGLNLSYLSNDLKNNKELVLIAVNQRGSGIQYASDDLRADEEVINAAINNMPGAIKFINPKTKDLYIKKIQYSLKFADEGKPEFFDDKDIVKILIETAASKHTNLSWLFYNRISDRLRCDKEIALQALRTFDTDDTVLKYLCDDLKDDEEVVHLAVSKNKDNIFYASKRLQKEAGTVKVRIEKTVTKTTTTTYETVVVVPIEV